MNIDYKALTGASLIITEHGYVPILHWDSGMFDVETGINMGGHDGWGTLFDFEDSLNCKLFQDLKTHYHSSFELHNLAAAFASCIFNICSEYEIWFHVYYESTGYYEYVKKPSEEWIREWILKWLFENPIDIEDFLPHATLNVIDARGEKKFICNSINLIDILFPELEVVPLNCKLKIESNQSESKTVEIDIIEPTDKNAPSFKFFQEV